MALSGGVSGLNPQRTFMRVNKALVRSLFLWQIPAMADYDNPEYMLRSSILFTSDREKSPTRSDAGTLQL